MAIPWKFSARAPGQLIQSADPNHLSADIRNSQTGVSVTLFGSSVAAIQNAINTVGAAGGGTVFFPAGTYELGGTPLYIQYSDITLRFEPGAGIHQTGNAVDGIRIGAASDGSFVQVSNIRIEGGSFVGDADGTGTNVARGVYVPTPGVSYGRGFGGSSNITIDGVSMEGWTMGLDIHAATSVRIQNSHFTGMRYAPTLAAGGYSVVLQAVYGAWVENCTFVADATGDRHAIYVQAGGSGIPPEDVHLLSNSIDWRTPTNVTKFESAITAHGTIGLEVVGNTILGGYSGFDMSLPWDSDAQNVVVSGNTFIGQLGDGTNEVYYAVHLWFDDTQVYRNVVIANNAIKQSGPKVGAFRVQSAANLQISDNVVHIAGDSVGVWVQGNTGGLIGPNMSRGPGGIGTGEYYTGNTDVRRIAGGLSNWGTPQITGGTLNATSQDATLITDLTADASPVGSTDYVMTWDASAGALKKVLLDDLPGGGGGSITRHTEDFTGSATDTFVLAAAPIDADHVTVYVNGLRQIPTTDWTLAGDTITTTFTVDAADTVSVEYWVGSVSAITRHAEEFTGSATASFVLAAAPIDAAHVTVFVNGLRQIPTTDWTLAGSTITTTFTADATDKVSVEYWT